MLKQNIQILQDYVDYLNQLCNKVITDSRLSVVVGQSTTLLVARYQGNEILPLELKPKGYLHFRQTVTLQSSKVVINDSRYIYSFSPDPDEEEKWIFRYEYRLDPQDRYPRSHFHVNAIRGSKSIKHIHFPTARISLEQIIAHLIIEHEILPKCAEWFDILAESHRGFIERRSDPLSFP